jgi:putative ABC transport system substrate-binding protein
VKRRQFISLIGGAAALPLAARAQQQRMRRIGVLTSSAENDPEAQAGITAFREELRKLGWAEGRNLAIDIRWTKADAELMTRSANDLAALAPDVILTSSTPAPKVMLQQTRTIPVVSVLAADPVGSGFVASLPKPGGNATGFTPIVGSLGGKWVELVKEIAPGVSRINLIYNPPSAPFIDAYLGSFKAAATSLGVEASIAPVADMREVEAQVSAGGTNSGLVVIPDAFTVTHRAEIAGAGRSLSRPFCILVALLRRTWRPDHLRSYPCRRIPPRRRLCRPHPQGREAVRASGADAGEVRAGHQHEARKGVRIDGDGQAARAGG